MRVISTALVTLTDRFCVSCDNNGDKVMLEIKQYPIKGG